MSDLVLGVLLKYLSDKAINSLKEEIDKAEKITNAFCEMIVIGSDGRPSYRGENGVPIEMPKRIQRKVKEALK